MITNNNIDGGKPFDWGRASSDYAKYRDIYPRKFYEKIHFPGIGASLHDDEISAFEREHIALLEKIPPQEFDVLHYCAICVMEKI